jgi:hypothetical protein
MQIPLLKGDTVDDTVDYRDRLPTNMTAILRQIKGAAGYMLQWFGLTKLFDGSGTSRGAKWISSSENSLTGHYRVQGTKFVEITETEEQVLGDVGEGGQCSIFASFNNVAVVAGGKLYYYNRTAGFREITGSQVGNPIDGVWIDNVFVLTDGINVYHSNPLNEEEFLANDFTNPQFKPDAPLGVGVTEDNELVVYQRETTEFFVNTGGDDFLFTRIPSKAVTMGVVGTHAKTFVKGQWIIISSRKSSAPSVHLVAGGREESVASREVEKVLKKYTSERLKLSTMDGFSIDAIDYVLLHLPGETLLFNLQAAKKFGPEYAWSILKTDVLGDRAYRAKDIVQDQVKNKWIVGDKRDGSIGYLDETKATHYDEIAEWLIYSPFLALDSLSIDSISLQTIPGFSPDNDATIFVSRTEDGLSYGLERTVEYGKDQDYLKRWKVRRMGYVRNFTGFRFRGASRSRFNLAFFDVQAS